MKSYKIIKEITKYDNGKTDIDNGIEIYINKDYFSYPIDVNFIFSIDNDYGRVESNVSKHIKIQKINSSKYIICFLPSIIGEISSHKISCCNLIGLSIYSIIEPKSVDIRRSNHTIFTARDIFLDIKDNKDDDINVLNTLLNKGITCIACDNEE